MWQKAIVKSVIGDRLRFMLGKEVWVEGPPCGEDSPSGRCTQYSMDENFTKLTPVFDDTIDYKTNIVHDDYPLELRSTRLGMAPHMLELLAEFRESPIFIHFSDWRKGNA